MIVFITCDVFNDITGDIMLEGFTTRTSGVPRGLLRFLVINMLMNKPMSGVEIVNTIEKETNGRWKPSSGSIYPLLSKLNEKGYTIEHPSEEKGIKRYALTKKGKQFFEKHVDFSQKMMNKLDFIVPLVVGGFCFGPDDEEVLSGPRKPAKRVVSQILELRPAKVKLTKEDANHVEKIMNKFADELEVFVQKIHEKNQNTYNN